MTDDGHYRLELVDVTAGFVRPTRYPIRSLAHRSHLDFQRVNWAPDGSRLIGRGRSRTDRG